MKDQDTIDYKDAAIPRTPTYSARITVSGKYHALIFSEDAAKVIQDLHENGLAQNAQYRYGNVVGDYMPWSNPAAVFGIIDKLRHKWKGFFFEIEFPPAD